MSIQKKLTKQCFDPKKWLMGYFSEPIIPTPEIGEEWIRKSFEPFSNNNVAIILDVKNDYVQYRHKDYEPVVKHSESFTTFAFIYEKEKTEDEVES